MQATVARLEITPPSWEQVGGWLAALAVAAGGIWAGFKGNWKSPQLPKAPEAPVVASASDGQPSPLEILRQLVKSLQEENERIREQVGEQDTAMQHLRRQIGEQDTAMRDLRRQLGEQDSRIQALQAQVRRHRARLAREGIDPGEP